MSKRATVYTQLLKMLESGWPSSGVIPPVRALAAHCSTSTNTIQKVLDELHRHGLLHRHGAQGRYVTRIPGETGTHPSACPSLTDRLREYAIDKRPAPGHPFPSRKALCRHFNTTYPSLRSAITQLASEGIIQVQGRRLYPAAAGAPPHSRSICVIIPRFFSRSYNDQINIIFTALDREVDLMGWGRIVYRFADVPSECTAIHPGMVSGIIYCNAFHRRNHPELTASWEQWFTQFQKIPLVVFDFTGAGDQAIRLPPQSRYLVCDNRAAGRTVAMHCVNQGHQHIAYLSHIQEGYLWERQRLRGIHGLYSPAHWGVRHLTFHRQTVPRSRTDTAATLLLQRNVNAARTAFLRNSPLAQGSIKKAFEYTNQLLLTQKILERFEPAFQRFTANSSITAWICANDTLAAAAVTFLHCSAKYRNTEIISFDNSPAALSLGFSSFDFLYDRLARRCVRTIIAYYTTPNTVVNRNAYQIGQLITRERQSGAV